MSHPMLPHSVATMFDTDKTRTQLTNGDAIFLKNMNKVLAPEAGQFNQPGSDGPEDPIFESSETKMGKIMMVDFFEIQTSYLRAVSIHEHEETRKQLKDQHAEAMKEIATMIFTNTYTVEKLNPELAEIQNTLSRNVTALNISAEASKEVHDLTSSGLNAIMTELDKQNALVSNGFNNLIPSEGTEAAISLEKLTKDLNKEINASEDRTKMTVRTEANGIKANQKFLHNSTGPRNGTKSSGPTTNNSGPTTTNNLGPNTNTNNSGPAAAPAAANNSGPTPTTTPQTANWPNWVPEAAREPPPPPEMVTIPRKNVKKNEETGEWDEEWVDAIVKKRPNPKFVFRDDLETNRKNERIYMNNKIRAGKELMIYNVRTPPLPDKKGDMKHVIDISEEIRVAYLQSEGYDLQREDLKDAEVTRLWNYGGKDFKGEKPIKATFKSAETVTRFLVAAEAGGFLGSRRLINKGKYQGAKDLEAIPKWYVRASTTVEERQEISDRIRKKEENKKSAGYANWIAKKTREREFKTKIGAEDLENWTLGPADFPNLPPPVAENNGGTSERGAGGTPATTGTGGTPAASAVAGASAPVATNTKRAADGATGDSPSAKVQKESPAPIAASTLLPGDLKVNEKTQIVTSKDQAA